MTTSALNPTGVLPPAQRPKVISDAEVGTLILVTTEIMFFVALISAYMVIRAGTNASWVPPVGVRLPVPATAFNTAMLLISGLLTALAVLRFEGNPGRARLMFIVATGLGGFFVLFQGYEWVQLITYGMTMTSGIFGATFFLLIGSHGLHVLGGVLAMLYVHRRWQRGQLTKGGIRAMFIFWAFVVGIWPVLYGLVYF